MEISGESVLAAAPDRVRAALTDPALVARLLDAPEFTPVAPGQWRGTVLMGAPPLAQRRSVLVRLSSDDAAVSLDLSEEGAADGLHLVAHCRLEGVAPERTRLRYDVRARLGGLARLIGTGAARRGIEDFFAALAGHLSGAPAVRSTRRS